MVERIAFAAYVLYLAAAFGQNWTMPPAAKPTGTAPSERLPVKRVVLYKNGIGYFKHIGRVIGDQDVTISFTSGQLNDVLKSLTILDLDGGRVGGVTYGSEAPVERRLGGFSLPAGEKATLADFLTTLRGARIEVRAGPLTFAGRVLGIERKTRATAVAALDVDYLTLVSDSGEIRSIEFTPDLVVRLQERNVAEQVGRYMGVLSSARDTNLRRMVVAAAGSGERRLSISYISEVPVWKTTYRVVVPAEPGKAALLQGWAIIDNTVGEDCEDVELSLVAGAPHSFVQKLSQPYFARRPEVPLPDNVTVLPQTHEAALVLGGGRLTGTITDPAGAVVPGARVRAFDQSNAMVGTATSNSSGVYEIAGLPDGVLRFEVESPGFARTTIPGVTVTAARTGRTDAMLKVGGVSETVTVQAAAVGLQTSSAERSSSSSIGSGRALGSGANLAGGRSPGQAVLGGQASASGANQYQRPTQAAAFAEDLGDLFQFRLKEPVTIHQNQSALVPIIATTVAAEKVSVWNASFGSGKPQRALWLTNASDLTLDGGSFSVLEGGAFAGEGIVDPVRPGERRLVSYANDLAVTVSARRDTMTRPVTRVRVARGVLVQTREQIETRTYAVRNEDTAERTIIVEHPVLDSYELRGGVKPVETTPAWYRFRLNAPSKQTVTLTIEQARPVETTVALSSLDDQQVGMMVRQQTITKELEATLRKLLERKQAVASLEEKKESLETEIRGIFDDQQRLRENLKSLKGTAEEKALVQRYTSQLNQQEDRLATLRVEVLDAEAKVGRAEEDVDAFVQGLVFDASL